MTTRRTPMLLAVAALGLASTAGAQDTRVVFERTGYRLTAIGASTTVNARVLNGTGRPVPNAPIRFRTDDPDIASVNARGVVVSRRVGRTRLWAASGSDSASALLIVDQWAAQFTFVPAVVRLDAVGQRSRLEVQARDAAGNPISGINGNCRVKNDAVAQLAAGQVVARANGVTYVRCTDRGIADSVRIEVRQRPQRIAIQDKNSLPTLTVGENFQLRLSAYDAEGGEIPSPSPTWASLDTRAINIDPLTGFGRAVGATEVPAKVVAQYGDVTDTVAIAVRPGAGLGIATLAAGPATDVAPATTVVETARSALLRLDVLSPAVGDTLNFTVTVRDATGTAVEPERVRIRSSDTTIVRYVGRQRIVGVKEGAVYLVGAYESLTDSALINVRARGTVISSGEATPFERPSHDIEAARVRNRNQLDSARAAIRASSPIRSRLRQMIAVSGTVGQVAHATSATVLEERTGLLFGGTGTIMPWRWLALTGDIRAGTLTPNGPTGEDMRVTEAEGALNFAPWDWLTLRAGYTMRAQTTETAKQDWTFPSATALFRFRFVGGAVSTVFGGSLLPLATYSGHQDEAGNDVHPNPTSMAGQAGLEWTTRIVNAGLHYYVERFTFPPVAGLERVDQFSMLRLKFGFQLGR